MRLAFGEVEFSLDDLPQQKRWEWFADLLSSTWGLSTRLNIAHFCEVEKSLELVSHACRLAGQNLLTREKWGQIYDKISEIEHFAEIAAPIAVNLALSSAIDIAMEATDYTSPNFDVAIALAFEAMISKPGARDDQVREWFSILLEEASLKCSGDSNALSSPEFCDINMSRIA